ncbi:hypothetical protein NAL32_10615 [Chryseobacterium sp. Ch-15]|uniref:Uncharacterized protein n=1 Tax=Chryseobacterium muglaense TaxID=2893752 RepID=A0A9Q3UXB5_9FLAO|nr:hypothetical protein [Chryseobacterium muglaense]MBD3903387.1 hypothetical protein [Chryseobacterium muglaense]MCC9036287.1 hypothetical protein [Chryseobacterium muglaense]MCM2554834.1 hypothetical protein [Chryseobacterium muglaense]
METTLKQKGQKWLQWAVHNPKKFFTYSMILLSVSFIGSLIQGIFFPSETAFKIRPPVLYSKSNMSQNPPVNNDKEMEKIVTELKTLKVKRDQNALEKEDSLRIDYLFNQYQKLKNGR